MSEIEIRDDEDSPGLDTKTLSELLNARRPAVYFAAKIGDSILTLPAVRALGEMFTAPITLICPKVSFELCFREVSSHFVDITTYYPDGFPPTLGAPPGVGLETLVAEIGDIDVLVNTVVFNLPVGTEALRQRLAPLTTIGFENRYENFDITVEKEEPHAADLMFSLARLFDPKARIETYAQPVPVPPAVLDEAKAIRAAVPPGARVLVVHADSLWAEKRWPVTRFIELLNRFLSRHPNHVAWVVGMGHEELNAGAHGNRVISYLGRPLDLTVALVANADLFVGIDSSMLHAADLARVPGVGLFGPTRPTTWGFRFAPHRHIDEKAMADITTDQVLIAMEDLVTEHV